MQLPRVGPQVLVAALDRLEQPDDRLGYLGLERAVALAVVAGLDRLGRLAERGREDLDQVRDPGLVRGAHDLATRVRDRRAQLLADHIGRVEQAQHAGVRVRRRRHPAGRILEVHQLRPDLRVRPLGHRERVAKAVVEPLRDITGQLQMLALVLTDRHSVGLVEEDVRRLENRVREQRDAEAMLLRGLLAVLGHPAQVAVRCHALEHPCEPRVLGHVALDEQRRHVRVEPAGNEQRGQ